MSSLFPDPGLGLGTTCHCSPSQCSTRVRPEGTLTSLRAGGGRGIRKGQFCVARVDRRHDDLHALGRERRTWLVERVHDRHALDVGRRTSRQRLTDDEEQGTTASPTNRPPAYRALDRRRPLVAGGNPRNHSGRSGIYTSGLRAGTGTSPREMDHGSTEKRNPQLLGERQALARPVLPLVPSSL
jgi:hypothetical protein